MPELTLDEIRELARVGIKHEITRLQALLERLETGGIAQNIVAPSMNMDAVAPPPPAKRRGRRPMTKAEKKALGETMRKIWAAKKKGAAAKPAP